MPFLRRDDVSLYYELTEGRSPPVVLLHGWCCDHTFLAPQAAHLAARGHAVLSLDLRGHGRSDKPEQPYPIGAFSEDVAWILGALGLARPVLVGHSMGGIIAYDIAARWPDMPATIVMLDAAVVLPEAARAAVVASVAKLDGPDHAAVQRRMVEEVFFLPTDDPARREAILATMTAAPRHVMVAAYAGLGRYDAAAAGRAVAPSLYIAANEPSPRCDMARLRGLLPELRQGQTVGSGHFCQLEVPDQINAMIDRFLALVTAPEA
ncbi:MAG: alpha/beta hydrolase [Rhodovulum sulfidophilum]|uniref:Alpha/beta hydrolase n=1 Tax=Rhodovulum sulfidophilum TaxID=35806 RepID=A0A2W5NCH0_RHOSU|nr:MAG: alpha/beta hydrolase [Rhodovulum sulfidophilum]